MSQISPNSYSFRDMRSMILLRGYIFSKNDSFSVIRIFLMFVNFLHYTKKLYHIKEEKWERPTFNRLWKQISWRYWALDSAKRQQNKHWFRRGPLRKHSLTPRIQKNIQGDFQINRNPFKMNKCLERNNWKQKKYLCIL